MSNVVLFCETLMVNIVDKNTWQGFEGELWKQHKIKQ